MVNVRPFRALRPKPSIAAQIAAVPYDVVNAEEARSLADGNPVSFLRVSRAEIELPAGTDPHSDAVYEKARANFDALKSSSLLLESEPLLYVYRLKSGDVEQTGVAGAFSVDDYNSDVIRKHERTRRDKEDDRTRHIITLRAQTGPVFLTYKASPRIDELVARITAAPPLYDFEAADGVRHTIWTASGDDRDELKRAIAEVPTMYIADGHHRAASAARAWAHLKDRGATASPNGSQAGAESFLAVAFPHDQVQVLAYNRVVRDLNGLSPAQFLDAVRKGFHIERGAPVPSRRGDVAMYLQGEWRTLHPLVAPDASDAVRSLDVSVLQDRLLAPILGILDVRTDKRIDFVGGGRGAGELERLVDSGAFAAAFSLFPVRVSELMAVSDQGEIMPPKSTWFEPKLRDGLLVHVI
ncbi:MAG: DUF1015 domain-containing protein [Vicinamibacterales bacterium]